jgi:hypothetical protein
MTGANLILSANSSERENRELFRHLEHDEKPVREYFARIGFILQTDESRSYFYFAEEGEDEGEDGVESLLRLAIPLHALFKHAKDAETTGAFSTDCVFSDAQFVSNLSADQALSDYIIKSFGEGKSLDDACDKMLQSLVRSGFLEVFRLPSNTLGHKALCAINALGDIVSNISMDITPNTPDADAA